MTSPTLNDLILMRLDMLDRRVDMIERTLYSSYEKPRFFNNNNDAKVAHHDIDNVIERIVAVLDERKSTSNHNPNNNPNTSIIIDHKDGNEKLDVLVGRRRSTIAG